MQNKKKDTDDRIGRRIRYMLHLRGLSLRQVSEQIGVPYRSFQDSLTRPLSIRAEVLKKLSGALGVSADWLLSGHAAPLDLVAVEEAFDVIEDIAVITGKPLNPPERAAMFTHFYRKSHDERLPIAPLGGGIAVYTGPPEGEDAKAKLPADRPHQPRRPRPRPTKAPKSPVDPSSSDI